MRTYGDLFNISKIGEVIITCKDAELKAKLDETAYDVFLKSLDFTKKLLSKSLADRNYDMIVLLDFDSFNSQAELTLLNIVKVLKSGDRVCILADDFAVAKIQSMPSTKEICMTVFLSAENSFVIGQKSLNGSGINGTKGHAELDRITIIKPTGLIEITRAAASDIGKVL